MVWFTGDMVKMPQSERKYGFRKKPGASFEEKLEKAAKEAMPGQFYKERTMKL